MKREVEAKREVVMKKGQEIDREIEEKSKGLDQLRGELDRACESLRDKYADLLRV